MQTNSNKMSLFISLICVVLILIIIFMCRESKDYDEIIKENATKTTDNKSVEVTTENLNGTLETESSWEILEPATTKISSDFEFKLEEIKTEKTEHPEEAEFTEFIESKEINVEQPFSLTDYERWIAECIVMGECGYEPYEGQLLVAQCLLNACLKDNLQPSEARMKYQYSGWQENPNDSVKEAVRDVFDKGYRLTDEFVLYFYAPKYSKGRWHETQRFIMEVGGHRFFAEWDD